jgi:RNase H-fold protein (predicted Holliday junction resolvase)
MKILGIDYGLKNIGLSVAETKIAEPYGVIRLGSLGDLIKRLVNTIGREEIDVVVVGVSEGLFAEKTRSFVNKLQEKIEQPIYLVDETLTTNEAEKLTIQAGTQRK